MADETKTIENLPATAKAALLEAITASTVKETLGAPASEVLARAYAAVATAGPVKGEVPE